MCNPEALNLFIFFLEAKKEAKNEHNRADGAFCNCLFNHKPFLNHSSPFVLQSETEKFKLTIKDAQWQGQRFDHLSDIIHLKDRCLFYTCCRAKPGAGVCCYAVCEGCKLQATETVTGRPSRDRSVPTTPNTEKHKKCCHALQDLEIESDPWWCNPDRAGGLFSVNWLIRAKGCVGCNKMFVYKAKKGWKPSNLTNEMKGMYEKLDNGELDWKDIGLDSSVVKKSLDLNQET